MVTISASRRGVVIAIFAVLLLGCGDQPPPESAAARPAQTAAGHATDQVAEHNRPGARERVMPAAPEAAAAEAGMRVREVIDPDSYTIGWIYYDWSGVDPELDAVAERKVVVNGIYNGQRVNEFNRAELLAIERARLEQLFAQGRGIATIVTDIGSQLSEYDTGYGEFYINAFAPGSLINFPPLHSAATREQHKGIDGLFARIKLTNALQAYVWKVPAEQAAELIALFEREGNGRNVYARTRLKILGAKAAAVSERVIEAEIQSFTLFTRNNTLLAEFNLAN